MTKKPKKVTPSEKPYGHVTDLAKPTRSGETFTSKWTVPKNATDTSRKDQWEGQTAYWTFTQKFGGTKNTGVKKKTVKVTPKKSMRKTGKNTYAAVYKSDVKVTTTRQTTKEYQAFQKSYDKTLRVTTSNKIVYKYNQKTIKAGKVNPKTGQKVKKTIKIYDQAKGAVTQTGQKIVRCEKIPKTTKSLKQKIEFDSYHPKVPYRYLSSVTLTVFGYNRVGNSSQKKSSAYKFAKPKTPTMTGVTFNSDNGGNGVASVTITSKDDGKHHRYRTCYWVTRQDNINAAYKSDKIIKGKSYSSKESIPVSVDITEFGGITYEQYIKLTFRAFAQGCMGDSAQVTPKRYTIAYPSLAVIKDIQVKPDTLYVWDSRQDKFVKKDPDQHNGIVIVTMGFVNTSNHPVDKVELYRLKSKAKTAEEAAAISDGWEKVKADNGNVSAMQDTIAAAYPPTGIRVWYRLVTTHGPFTRIGPAFEAADLYHGPSRVTFLDAKTMDDGTNPTSIQLTYGFAQDEATGTQLEWSTFLNAIRSNHPPDTYDDLEVLNEADAKDLLVKYGKTQSGIDFVSQFYITDLTEGEKYYISGARYAETNDGRILGDRTFWRDPNSSAVSPVLFGMKPRNVALSGPSSVPSGSTLSVSWTFDSVFEQTAYTLHYVTADGVTVLRPRTESSEMSTLITLDEIAKASYRDTETGATKIALRVSVETSGLEATSSNKFVTIMAPPDCQISWPTETSVLTKQPVKLNYRCTQTGRLFITVFAEGCVGDIIPDVEYVQADGDTVWTGAFDVGANASDVDPATITLPEGLEFHQNGKYTIEAFLRNSESNLESEIRELGFSVDWEHKAERPSELSTIECNREDKSVKITPRRPENFDTERPDVCDIYRTTPDGSYLVARGVDFGTPVIDRYAPYTNTGAILRYNLVTRTRDGDTEPIEIGYGLPGYALRFEWLVDPETKAPKHVLELPYNLRIGDAYEKDFERQRGLDGSVVGTWNDGVLRTGSLQTDLIKLSEPRQKELVRHMAQYPGPIFVRTPDGCAYVADVQVTNFQTDYDSLVVPVSITASEIDLIDAFRATVKDNA